MSIGTFLSVSYMTGLENTKKNQPLSVLAHKQCKKPIIIPNFGYVRKNTTLKEGEFYCENCDRTIDLGDHNEVYFTSVSKEKYDKIRKQEKEKKNGVTNDLKTIEDKLGL